MGWGGYNQCCKDQEVIWQRCANKQQTTNERTNNYPNIVPLQIFGLIGFWFWFYLEFGNDDSEKETPEAEQKKLEAKKGRFEADKASLETKLKSALQEAIDSKAEAEQAKTEMLIANKSNEKRF